jgi:hypothetical protein
VSSPERSAESFAHVWADSDDRSSRVAIDFRDFHARVSRLLAEVGPIEGLIPFLHEVRVTGRLVQEGSDDLAEHSTLLKGLMEQIEGGMPIGRVMRLIEASANEIDLALVACRKTLADAELREGEQMEAELGEVQRQWKEIKAERARDAEERMAATFAEELRQIEAVTARGTGGRAQALAELKEVHAKIADLHAQRREGGEEMGRLIEEQGGLIEMLARLS